MWAENIPDLTARFSFFFVIRKKRKETTSAKKYDQSLSLHHEDAHHLLACNPNLEIHTNINKINKYFGFLWNSRVGSQNPNQSPASSYTSSSFVMFANSVYNRFRI